MGIIGVDESIGRKMLTAVSLQFVAMVTLFVIGVVSVGVGELLTILRPVEIGLFGLVFGLAIVAQLNTVYIIDSDFVGPITAMWTAADEIARGELDSEVPVFDQDDEIGELSSSFESMHEYIRTAAAQADAIGTEDFQAAVLDEDIPGSFGESLSQMERNLQDRIEDLEQQRAAIEERNVALEETAESYQRTITRIAEGDLSQRLESNTDNRAMAEIRTSFNQMLDDMEETMATLIAFAEQVAEESRDVQTSADEVRNASEDISESIQEISMGVDQEAERLDETADEAENLSATIQEITASGDNVATLTDETAAVGEEGREAAEGAIDEMHAIEKRTDATVEAVTELNETLGEIEDITDVILDIADQTNILALNAGIEAARASEGGEGFAVVAEEVKNLAEETKESAENIGSLIDQVQDQSEDTVSEIKAMTQRVDSGVETVANATTAFERMAENVSSINTSIKEVSEATADQAESTQDVVAMVEDISSISAQTSAEAQTVAAAAQEQAATLNTVAEHTDTLAENARELEQSLDTFTLSTSTQVATDFGTASETTHSTDESEPPTSMDPTDGNEMEWQSIATDGGDDN
ncbi:MAG: methyl-accepting chemotaxis protein [Halanaeroarchaeum sp.]